MFPNSARESAASAYEYVNWLAAERGCSASGELKALHSMIALAKFLYHKESKADPAEGDKVQQTVTVCEMHDIMDSLIRVSISLMQTSALYANYEDLPMMLPLGRRLRPSAPTSERNGLIGQVCEKSQRSKRCLGHIANDNNLRA